MRDLEQPHTANTHEFPLPMLKSVLAATIENPGSAGVIPPTYEVESEFDMAQPLQAPHQQDDRPGAAAYL